MVVTVRNCVQQTKHLLRPRGHVYEVECRVTGAPFVKLKKTYVRSHIGYRNVTCRRSPAARPRELLFSLLLVTATVPIQNRTEMIIVSLVYFFLNLSDLLGPFVLIYPCQQKTKPNQTKSMALLAWRTYVYIARASVQIKQHYIQ